jgi:pimeloyl-ACP methyl ester carboxylesterase
VNHPTPAQAAAPDDGWAPASVDVDDHTTLRGQIAAPTSDDAPWIIAFPGDGMPLAEMRVIVDRLREGHDVGAALFAYRGYERSDGEPEEGRLLSDAEAVFAALGARHGVDAARTLVVGQSLGTGVATHLAATLSRAGTPPAGLLLVSPYRSIPAVFDAHCFELCAPLTSRIPERFATEEIISSVQAPVLLIHATEDTLIPIEHARALALRLPAERVALVEVPSRDHVTVWDHPWPRKAATTFVERVLTPPE